MEDMFIDVSDITLDDLVITKEITEKYKNIKNFFLVNAIEIADEAFMDIDVEYIEAGNLKKIGNRSLKNCKKLATFVLPETLEEIGLEAFSGTFLNEINIPKNVKKIGEGAFKNCINLLKVDINATVTILKESLFENCISLKEITFPQVLNKIKDHVFKGCKTLTQITFPEHLKSIGVNAFWECENLKKVVFNNEIKEIKDYAFGDTKVDVIELPDTLERIGITPFHMCYQLNKLKINKIFHDEILDKTNSKLKEIIINNEEIILKKAIKRIINYNNMIVIIYVDDTFEVLSKPMKYYDQEYFNVFGQIDLKEILKHQEICNIYYWESILGIDKLKQINPISIIALPPNINTIKAFYSKYAEYKKIIDNLTDFYEILSMIKFITIFGGLCKKNNFNIEKMIEKIGIRAITKQFKNVNVRELNQRFIKIYLHLLDNATKTEINGIMPFLYNNIERIEKTEDTISIDTLETLKLESEVKIEKKEISVVKSDENIQNYEWLDTTNPVKILWGYILASVSERNIDNDDVRSVVNFKITDENNLVIGTSRAYYSADEKTILFNSIKLSQSFLNKEYDVERIKELLQDNVIASISEILNFLIEKDDIVNKVKVGISDKEIREQLINKGTKIINQNI